MEPTGLVDAPDSVVAQPLGMRSVRLTWQPVPAAAGYTVERRANLTGAFTAIKHLTSPLVSQFVDDSLEPETTYGYRVLAMSYQGVGSTPSLVAGARTAPWPGIIISVATNPQQLAPHTGYQVTVAKDGDTLQAALGSPDDHRFGTLPPGTYATHLTGATSNCTVADGVDRTATVTNQGLQTLQYVYYNVSCRDPNRGSLTVNVATTGDSLDADGYQLKLTGVADDASLADSQRAFFQEDNVGAQTTRQYPSLRPGQYTVELGGLAGNCTVTVQGGVPGNSYSFHLSALEDLSRAFAVVCPAAQDPTKPLVWRSTWSTPSAPQGAHVTLTVSLDLTQAPTKVVTDMQAISHYDPSVVRFDSVAPLAPFTGSGNDNPTGTITWAATKSGAGIGGTATFARFYFTVVGSVGATTTWSTNLSTVENGFTEENLIPLIRKSEGSFTVAAGSANQMPVARPGGPYSGSVGNAINFSGGTSSDPDGTIATYQWSFGDGGTSTGMSPSHTYAAASNYTVTLTVTDNGGATATATTMANVSGGGGGNMSPIAVPSGPYGGVAGTPVLFDGTGSHDNDGSIATYSWNFGDGGTGSGASPTHTYAAAGTYTVSLTVTDNQGATGSASTSANISGGGATPFTWRNDFGAVGADSIVSLTITLDLSTDISQTGGPEELAEWHVDSLKWNPAVLQYYSFNFGPGGAGSVNPTNAGQGKLLFHGVQNYLGNTGLITIALVKFRVIGAHGSQTSTTTALGSLVGTSATGSFGYRPYTAVVEGTVTAP